MAIFVLLAGTIVLNRVAIIVALITLAMLPSVESGAPKLHAPNAVFFLITNDDVMEAVQAYAEVLCLQDHLVDHTPTAILNAGSICQDSRRNADGDSLTRDGAWRAYIDAAYGNIVSMCSAEGSYELCRWFK